MIVVCSLADQRNVCESVNASHLISVVDPGYLPDTPNNIKKHLKLSFDDIIEINNENSIYRTAGFSTKQILPNKNHINEIVNFVNTWDQSDPIVIHCWCGVSRSMATAIFLLCKIYPENVDKNVRYMRSIAPHANPNKLMVSMFEHYLKISGQIIEAFNKYPHTIAYDCATTFAPVTIFNIEDLSEFR